MDVLQQKLSQLPKKSGVYIMFDCSGNIIYVGKAKVLHNRVSQYFNKSSKPAKVMAMVSNITDLTYIITNSERDALALEANLIKKHKPHYNILLKDDKSHPYIRIDFRKDYPAVEVVRKVRNDGAKYWGPYFGGIRIAELVELIKSAFLVRACSGANWNSAKRVCINYHIELCSGACQKLVSIEEYHLQLHKLSAFLDGNDSDLAEFLMERMNRAIEEERFEHAIIYRDRLKSLEKINSKIISSLPKDTNMDIFGYATNNVQSCITVMIVRAGKTIAMENYFIQDSSFEKSECIAEFLVQYYDGTRGMPKEIIVSENLPEVEIIEDYLHTKYKHKSTITVPKIGTKKQLSDNCEINAVDYLKRSVDVEVRKADMTYGACDQLQQYLSLKLRPRRIECYDISNISGVDKVASMVVFVDGAADKSSYRRFKIKTVQGANDFASMKEVLDRRLSRIGEESFGSKPDLIVVDGGKGQLSVAHTAMIESGHEIQLIGLAKREEEVFRVGESDPVIIPKTSYALKLLQRVRDEAHRFAITYHRNLRSNRYLSQLEEIKGVGKEKRVALFDHFKSIEKIANADKFQLMEVKGIHEKLALQIIEYFSKKQEKSSILATSKNE